MLSLKQLRRYNVKYVIKKKKLSMLDFLKKNIDMTNIKLLKTHKNSLETLKHIVFRIANNSNSFFLKKYSKYKYRQSFLNLKNLKLDIYFNLNSNKRMLNIDKKRSVKTFYLKSLSIKKPSNARSFLKLNKRKIYITFKNFKKLSVLNESHLYAKYKHTNGIYNRFTFLLYYMFNMKHSIMLTNSKCLKSVFIRNMIDTSYETYYRSLNLVNYSLNTNSFHYGYMGVINNSFYSKPIALNSFYNDLTSDTKPFNMSLL